MTPANSPKLSIIVPTYKEAANLPELVHEVAAALAAAGINDWELLVIDDDSQDGLPQICAELVASGYPLRLHIRVGERDLSTAVLHGFTLATGAIFLVMDADLSHPPAAIPLLYRAIAEGYDFALGSRYLTGGEIEPRWGVFRHLNSRVASLLTAGLVRLRDPMSGFFALPRTLLESCPQIFPIGYKIGLEILVKSGTKRVIEVPIRFRHRRYGQSKLSCKQQLQYLRHLRWLYQFKYPRLAELGDLGVIGGLGFLVDLTVYAALYQGVGLHHLLSRIVSFAPGFSATWFFHRWTTQLGSRQATALTAPRRFLPILLVSAIGNIGSYWVLTSTVPLCQSQPFLALPISVALGAGINYLMYRTLIFQAMERIFRSPSR